MNQKNYRGRGIKSTTLNKSHSGIQNVLQNNQKISFGILVLQSKCLRSIQQ